MKRLLFGLLLLTSSSQAANQLSTVFNPFTGKPDYVNNLPPGGASSGTINNSTQFNMTYYSIAGSSNSLSGFSGLTVSTATSSIPVTITTATASSGTIRNLNSDVAVIHGSGAGQMAFREGLDSTVQKVGSGAAVIWASTATHWLMLNAGGVSTGAFVTSSAPITNGNLPVWSGQFGIIDSGLRPEDIGYDIEPASVTISANVGFTATTATVTSTFTASYVTRTAFSNVSTMSLSSAYFDASDSDMAINNLTVNGTCTNCGGGGGSGDAVLAATQTFTGRDTFSNIVTVSSHGVITSSNTQSALKVTANGIYGTTNGSSGGFFVNCTGGGGGSGMCSQIYTNAGAQAALGGLLNLISDNAGWNEPQLYTFRNNSNFNSDILVDAVGYPAITLRETIQSNPSSKKWQWTAHAGVLRSENRDNDDGGFHAYMQVSSVTFWNDIYIGPTYGNQSNFSQVGIQSSTGNIYALTLTTSTSNVAPYLMTLSTGGSAALWQGLTASSLTVNGSGNGEIDLTKADGTYKAMSSSFTTSSGIAILTSSQTLRGSNTISLSTDIASGNLLSLANISGTGNPFVVDFNHKVTSPRYNIYNSAQYLSIAGNAILMQNDNDPGAGGDIILKPQTDAQVQIPQGTLVISSMTFSASAFAALGAPANGTIKYCSDCTVVTAATCTANLLTSCVCAGSGSGAIAKRINGAWYCN